MMGFLVGWGVFWLLFWLAGLALGWLVRDDGVMGVSMLLLGVSVIYLIAVGVGAAVAG